MKTIIKTSLTKPIMVFVMFILLPVILFSQNDYIIFKNGKETRAKIISKTPDTLVYAEYGKPEVSYAITMEKVDTILSIKVLNMLNKSLTPKQELWKKQLHYQKVKKASIVLMACGTGLIGAGLIAIPEYKDDGSLDAFLDYESQVFGSTLLCVLGSATISVGAILLLNSSIQLKKVEKALKDLSLDLHGASGQPGITLSYKF